MTIIVAPTAANAASASALPNASSSQAVLTEGLPSEFASVFSQLVDRFNAFASEGKPKGDGPTQGLLKKALPSVSPNGKPLSADQTGRPLGDPREQTLQLLTGDALSGEQSLLGSATGALAHAVATQEKTQEEAAIREDASSASLDALAALANFMLPPSSSPQASAQGDSLLDQAHQVAGSGTMLPGVGQQLKEAQAQSVIPAATSSAATGPSEMLTAGGKPQQDFSAIIAGTQPFAEGAQAESLTPAANLSASHAANPVSANTTLAPPSGVEGRREISLPVGANGWAGGLGDQVAWMSRSNQQQAQISLNPPNLGPLQITLNLSSDQVTAQFVSPHAEVRQAIQDAMPQLKEMLASSGISLGQSSVGSEPSRQQHDPSAGQRDTSRFQADQAILDGDRGQVLTTPAPVIRGGRGMVDLFA